MEWTWEKMDYSYYKWAHECIIYSCLRIVFLKDLALWHYRHIWKVWKETVETCNWMIMLKNPFTSRLLCSPAWLLYFFMLLNIISAGLIKSSTKKWLLKSLIWKSREYPFIIIIFITGIIVSVLFDLENSKWIFRSLGFINVVLVYYLQSFLYISLLFA